MNSIEKVHRALEEVADMEDDELTDALPVRGVPLPVLRSLPAMVASALPRSSAELDEFLTQVGDFCHSLRSDPVPVDA